MLLKLLIENKNEVVPRKNPPISVGLMFIPQRERLTTSYSTSENILKKTAVTPNTFIQ
jgi:hypothetical protein